MIRRRVLAWTLVPVLACAALALVGTRVAPARADTTTRQIPSSGTPRSVVAQSATAPSNSQSSHQARSATPKQPP